VNVQVNPGWLVELAVDAVHFFSFGFVFLPQNIRSQFSLNFFWSTFWRQVVMGAVMGMLGFLLIVCPCLPLP
jgi:hypothetical protein